MPLPEKPRKGSDPIVPFPGNPDWAVDTRLLNWRGVLAIVLFIVTRGRLNVWQRHADRAVVRVPRS
jgi:hypothetical protein